jgi:NADH-quinone oxidoreductase subunit F
LAKGTGKPAYLVCNADESEPGTFKDRYLMEYIPHLMIEGLIVSSYALGANTCYCYIRGEFKWVIKIVEQAIAEAKAAGWLGKTSGKVMTGDIRAGQVRLYLRRETAPRTLKARQPRSLPFPRAGVWGCPTVVNNVETLATVPFIATMEVTATRNRHRQSTGTKLLRPCGHINKPAV